MHFQFQGQASLFSDRSSSERNALLLAANERVIRSILSTAPIVDHNWIVYRKSDFMFGNATPDTDQQLLAGEGQWIFTIEGEKLSSIKQATLPSFILPISNGATEDEVVCDRVH